MAATGLLHSSPTNNSNDNNNDNDNNSSNKSSDNNITQFVFFHICTYKPRTNAVTHLTLTSVAVIILALVHADALNSGPGNHVQHSVIYDVAIPKFHETIS